MANKIDNTYDFINSRDVIERVAELKIYPNLGSEDHKTKELETLKPLVDQCKDFLDWGYGLDLISESYFETFARELAKRSSDLDSNPRWPFNHIDWRAAAEDLKYDYIPIEFDGVTYYAPN